MPAQNPEIRLIIRILAIIGAVLILIAIGAYIFLKVKAPHLLAFSKNIEEHRITVALDTLEGARFITGMTGCENLVLSEKGFSLYVSCLDGNLHYLNGTGTQDLAVLKSVKPGNQVMGLAFGRDGMLYAAIGRGKAEEWMTTGGSVFRFAKSLDFFERLTEDYPAINGVACDSSGNIYFASSNFNFFNPEGWVYRLAAMPGQPVAVPEMVLQDAGVSNGLYYDKNQDKIFYSNTVVGVYEFSPEHPELKEVYLKLRFMEACDDLCTDISGNVWMTDPGYSTVKMFNPGTNRLVRFNIMGVGQTSSCRVRTENGVEMLYVTELKTAQKPMSKVFDGRGVLVVPTRSLIRLLEPILLPEPQ